MSHLKKVHIYQSVFVVKLHIISVSVLHFSWVSLAFSEQTTGEIHAMPYAGHTATCADEEKQEARRI